MILLEKNFTVIVKSTKYEHTTFLSIDSCDDDYVFTNETAKMKLISKIDAEDIISQLEGIRDVKISDIETESTSYIGSGTFSYHKAKVEFE